MRRPQLRQLLAFGSLVITGAAAPSVLSAQLPPPAATLEEEFTRILSVRELTDGRVLVSDDRDNRLVIADFRAGAVRSIGRIGRGPNEFEQPNRLFATRGDSTLMQDQGNPRRWLVIADDSIVATLPPDHPAITTSGGSLHGADALGYVLSRRGGALLEVSDGLRRSTSHVLRVDRASGRADTLAQARGITVASRAGGSGANTTVRNYQLVFSVTDQSVLFADGWVAIARSDPYRVDWHPPTSAPVLGAPIPYSPVKVTQEERQFWHDRIVEETVGAKPYDFSSIPFADEIPPFRAQGAFPAPDGTLLLHRERSLGAPGNDYDVIDRRGERVRTVRLPATQRIVGSGASTVYVAIRDDDGIERLQRHPWPGAGRR